MCWRGPTSRRWGKNRLAEIRNSKIGFVFQNFNLISRTTALENVQLPLFYRGIPAHEQKALALRALERVGLADRQLGRMVSLSVGQPHPLQRAKGQGLLFMRRYPSVEQGKLHVLQGSRPRNEVEVLKYEANLAVADFCQAIFPPTSRRRSPPTHRCRPSGRRGTRGCSSRW